MSSNDFHSLLSVFRDATSKSSNGTTKPTRTRGRNNNDNSSCNLNAPRASESDGTTKNFSSKKQTHQQVLSRDEREENTNIKQRFNCPPIDPVNPVSTTDPNFSATILKEKLERLLKVQQIRRSSAATSNGNGASSSKSLPFFRQTDKNEVCVAICATIVDDFPHENLWRSWMENTGGNFTFIAADFDGSGSNVGGRTIELKASAELYIHAKNPERVRSEWLR